VAADGGSKRRLLLLSSLFLLFPLLSVSVSLYILQFLTVIVWLLMVATGGGKLGRAEGGRWFFFPVFSSPSVSVLLLLSLLLLLLRSLTMVELMSLAVLLVTKQNDGGAASKGGRRETRERAMSYCSSPLFFCFSILSFYSLSSSSLPLFVRLTCFQNDICSSLKQSPASFSLFGSLLQVCFSKFLPPSGFLIFLFPLPPSSSARSFVFIGSWGEVRHTMFKCRAWVSVSFFFHNACTIWLCGYESCGFFGQVGWRDRAGKMI